MVKLFKIDRQLRQIKSHRPLDPHHDQIIRDKIVLDFIYNSISLDERKFSLKEASLFLFSEIVSYHRSTDDYIALMNHYDALMMVYENLERGGTELSCRFLDEIYRTLIAGLEITSSVEVENHPAVDLLCRWYMDKKNTMHPLVIAVQLNSEICRINPYGHFSGKVARLAQAHVLMSFGIPAVCVKHEKVKQYSNALDASKRGNMDSLINLTKEDILEVFDEILRIICGKFQKKRKEKHSIYRHRKERRLTLETLSQLSGISPSKISRIENGQGEPTEQMLEKFAQALNVSVKSIRQ